MMRKHMSSFCIRTLPTGFLASVYRYRQRAYLIFSNGYWVIWWFIFVPIGHAFYVNPSILLVLNTEYLWCRVSPWVGFLTKRTLPISTIGVGLTKRSCFPLALASCNDFLELTIFRPNLQFVARTDKTRSSARASWHGKAVPVALP